MNTRRRHTVMGLFLALLCPVLPAGAQERNPNDGPNLPNPPDGYVWRPLDYVLGHLPVPREWHWKVEQTAQSMNYFASKENIDVEGKFKTGMSIWVIRLEKGGDPADFGRRWVGELLKHGTLIDTSSNTTPPFRSFACRIRDTVTTDHVPVIIQNTAIANTQTRTLYLIVFESPEPEWNDAWTIGRAMMAGLILHPQK